ncbi:hypothetical protein [Rhizobium sp. BG4]|uniref:hypothetical protein n=1 Tax=Rhizobium sp. BG4 TaxID=2613770 RepID=UPI001FEE9D5A|nr:hypothetical protein [Rhizobium sp. BG4]
MVKLGDRHGLKIAAERANSVVSTLGRIFRIFSDVPQGNWRSLCEGAVMLETDSKASKKERRLGDVSRFVEAQEQADSSSIAPAAVQPAERRDERVRARRSCFRCGAMNGNLDLNPAVDALADAAAGAVMGKFR